MILIESSVHQRKSLSMWLLISYKCLWLRSVSGTTLKRERFCLPEQQASNAKPLLHSNFGNRKGEKLHIFRAGTIFIYVYIHTQTNDNYNLLICVLWYYTYQKLCEHVAIGGRFIRELQSSLSFPFASWGKPEKAALCSLEGRDVMNIVLAGQTKPCPARYLACSGRKSQCYLGRVCKLQHFWWSITLILPQHPKMFY